MSWKCHASVGQQVMAMPQRSPMRRESNEESEQVRVKPRAVVHSPRTQAAPQQGGAGRQALLSTRGSRERVSSLRMIPSSSEPKLRARRTVSELHAGSPSLHVTEHFDGASLHSKLTELQPSLPMQSSLPCARMARGALVANPHRRSSKHADLGASHRHGDRCIP